MFPSSTNVELLRSSIGCQRVFYTISKSTVCTGEEESRSFCLTNKVISLSIFFSSLLCTSCQTKHWVQFQIHYPGQTSAINTYQGLDWLLEQLVCLLCHSSRGQLNLFTTLSNTIHYRGKKKKNQPTKLLIGIAQWK